MDAGDVRAAWGLQCNESIRSETWSHSGMNFSLRIVSRILAIRRQLNPYSALITMSQDHSYVKPNVHSEAKLHRGEHSSIPHPPPEDHHAGQGYKPTPDTGWTGPVPSQQGGDAEQDFLNKPPYTWISEKFVPKYVR